MIRCFWPTLESALLSLAIMIVVSIPLGILAAVHQNRWGDYLVRALTFLGLSLGSLLGGTTVVEIAVAPGYFSREDGRAYDMESVKTRILKK